MELRIHLVCSVVLLCLSISSVTSQFYSDYSDGGGGGFLQPYDIPIVYKEQNYPAAYPVATTVYPVTLMKPIEAMPGKKTVPLYIIPEDHLQVGPSKRLRSKRSHSHPHDGLRVNIKYPEYFGLTDGYHIPAVEIPLNKPMILRQIEANVLAPSGFMVPYQGDNGEWPYPMNTGCLVGTIPRNTYVSEENPITIRKLYAVPSLPEYPTYRPVPQNRHGHSHLHIHGLDDPAAPVNDVLANYFTNRAPQPPRQPLLAVPHQHLYVQPKAPQPVFELVPVTQKSTRRNGKRRNGNKRKKEDSDEDEEDDDDKRDSDESPEDEDEDQDRRRDRPRNRERGRDRDRSRGRNRDRQRSRTTTTTTTTTTTPRTTTTTPTTTTRPTTTTAAASSIQDIIAAFSSYQNRPENRDREPATRSRLSAAFRDDRDDRSDRYRENRDRDRLEEGRGFSKNSEEPISSISSTSDIQELRQQMLTKQISQLQKLLTSLNLSTDPKDGN